MSEAEAMDRTADRHMTKLTRDEEKAILDMMNAPQLTVSGLIAELEKIEREHGGDLPVVMHDAAIAAVFLGGEIEWKQANYTMDLHPVRKYASTMHVGGFGRDPVYRYTVSLDACVALLNAVLPGALWSIWNIEDGPGCRLGCPGKSGGYTDGALVTTPYLEWTPPTVCAAMIGAIISAAIAQLEAREKQRDFQDRRDALRS